MRRISEGILCGTFGGWEIREQFDDILVLVNGTAPSSGTEVAIRLAGDLKTICDIDLA